MGEWGGGRVVSGQTHARDPHGTGDLPDHRLIRDLGGFKRKSVRGFTRGSPVVPSAGSVSQVLSSGDLTTSSSPVRKSTPVQEVNTSLMSSVCLLVMRCLCAHLISEGGVVHLPSCVYLSSYYTSPRSSVSRLPLLPPPA